MVAELSEQTDGAAEAAVEVTGLSKVYRSRARAGGGVVLAVDDVDLTVNPGELVVLLGPSGCGKTTLLRSIAGLERPDAGEVRIGGRLVFSSRRRVDLPPEQRHLGMMFQSYALWPHMTVLQNVSYPLKSLKGWRGEEIAARAREVLARLGVADLDHRFPGELSGGQQQRVALARALVASPSVILFDEPLSNVDAKVRRRLRAELRELKAQTHFAGVYVTHDQEEAMELADRLAVIEAGKIRQLAPSQEVYARPASVYVAGFVGEINCWPGVVHAIIDGAACVKTDFGIVRAPGGTVRPGDRGWLMVRPERVAVAVPGTASADGAFRGPGVVRDAIYLGARSELRIALEDAELVAWLPEEGRGGVRPQPGDAVEIVLPEGGVQWLPA